MPPSSSHMQTAGEAVDNTNHLSSSFQPIIRPSFLYNRRQNSSSSSSSLQASIRPSLLLNMHHNSSSSASSSHSQSVKSEPTVHEPVLHQSSSSNSLMNHDQDLPDEYELNLLSEVEIIALLWRITTHGSLLTSHGSLLTRHGSLPRSLLRTKDQSLQWIPVIVEYLKTKDRRS